MPTEKITIEGKRTLESVLKETREKISVIEEGQIFETLRSIYPDETVSSNIKNIEINDVRMTLPLCSSAKAKREYCKTSSSLKDLFKDDTRRGDFLIVKEVKDDGSFICHNISINTDKYDKYYNRPELKNIKLTKDDIAFGNVKRVYRGLKTLNIGGK